MNVLAIQKAFDAALAEARKFVGATAPNPPVGAAAIDAQGRLLGVQAHERAGTGHAEARLLQALREQGKLGQIHTLVVTLEPCNHHGRTPPCTEAVIAAKVPRVVYGVTDPNPKVAGKGAERLRAAGVKVDSCLGLLEHQAAFERLHADCAELIRPFAHWASTGMPWVTLKTAHQPGGSMIPPPGQKTFTSPESLQLAHELRKRADAILTGSGTVLADLPEFTVRRVPDHEIVAKGLKKRRLVVLDRRGRLTPPGSQVHPWIQAAEARGFEVLVRKDLAEALEELGKLGVLEVLIEAGPDLTTFVQSAGLWNRHVLITQGIESSTGYEPDSVHVVENVHWHYSKSRND